MVDGSLNIESIGERWLTFVCSNSRVVLCIVFRASCHLTVKHVWIFEWVLIIRWLILDCWPVPYGDGVDCSPGILIKIPISIDTSNNQRANTDSIVGTSHLSIVHWFSIFRWIHRRPRRQQWLLCGAAQGEWISRWFVDDLIKPQRQICDYDRPDMIYIECAGNYSNRFRCDNCWLFVFGDFNSRRIQSNFRVGCWTIQMSISVRMG